MKAYSMYFFFVSSFYHTACAFEIHLCYSMHQKILPIQLSSILLCGYPPNMSIHSAIDGHLYCFQHGAIISKAYVDIHGHVLMWMWVFFFFSHLVKNLGVKLPLQMEIMFNRNSPTPLLHGFSIVLSQSSSCMRVPVALLRRIASFKIFSHLNDVQWNLIVVLI